MDKFLFIPENGRKPIEVTSFDDIRAYMGEIMNYYDSIECINELVVAYKSGIPFTIGRIKTI